MVRRGRVVTLGKRVWWIALLAAGIPLLIGFNARLALIRQLFEEEARLARELETEHSRSEFLERFEQVAGTEWFAEHWALASGLIRQGQTLVRVQAPVPVSTPEVPLPADPPSSDYPAEWWAAFFADTP